MTNREAIGVLLVAFAISAALILFIVWSVP